MSKIVPAFRYNNKFLSWLRWASLTWSLTTPWPWQHGHILNHSKPILTILYAISVIGSSQNLNGLNFYSSLEIKYEICHPTRNIKTVGECGSLNWNDPHRLMCLNTWSQLVTLFRDMVEPFGYQAFLAEGSHPWSLVMATSSSCPLGVDKPHGNSFHSRKPLRPPCHPQHGGRNTLNCEPKQASRVGCCSLGLLEVEKCTWHTHFLVCPDSLFANLKWNFDLCSWSEKTWQLTSMKRRDGWRLELTMGNLSYWVSTGARRAHAGTFNDCRRENLEEAKAEGKVTVGQRIPSA